MTDLMDRVLRSYFRYRQKRIEAVLNNPHPFQESILKQLISANERTEYGKKYDFSSVKSYTDYVKAVPPVTYEDCYPYISKMLAGEKGLLVDAPVRFFAKSSGTTNDRSKYIPLTRNYLINGHMKCTWFTASSIYNEDPSAKLFAQKSLIMGGSLHRRPNGITVGDISAIMHQHFPKIGSGFATPPKEVALMKDWETKIKEMARICSKEKVTLIGGVPTWMTVLIKEILALTGAANLSEVWPGLRTYLHGGVGFEPYRELFKQYIPSDAVAFREVYNASEGYFAMQNNKDEDGMALLCDHQIFYEFIPYDKGQPSESIISLREVEADKTYAMVISNTSGLYRYRLGDLVRFSSVSPYKIKVVGRTQQYLNTFGEEVMIANTDRALAETAQRHSCQILEYTVAPQIMTNRRRGGHDWAIEFISAPENLERFSADLDKKLRELNSDYDAKRQGDLALRPLKIIPLPAGRITQWQKAKGKYGRQFKFPRLCNDRSVIEELLPSELSPNRT